MLSSLDVALGSHKVGTLSLLPGSTTLFVFDDAYRADANRPTLSQSYFTATGDLRQETSPTRRKLPPWFSNLLPEGALRDYLAKQQSINPNNEFALLSFLRDDLPGAVRVTARGPGGTPDDAHEDDSASRTGPLRFSLAGVQLKFSALAKGNRLTVPASGIGGDWIIKLPSTAYPAVPENEAAMLDLAARVGIPVPEHRLVPLAEIGGIPDFGLRSDLHALAVRRFDRDPIAGRIHMEDLAQVFGLFPHEKYEQVSSDRVAEMLGTVLGGAAAQDFVARLAFIVLTGNGDMHLKNWSLLYPDGRTPVLSPAYDLVSTIPYIPDEKLALSLGKEKAFASVSRETFRRFAERARLPERETLATVGRVADAVRVAWPGVLNDSRMPKEISDRIGLHLHSMRLN